MEKPKAEKSHAPGFGFSADGIVKRQEKIRALISNTAQGNNAFKFIGGAFGFCRKVEANEETDKIFSETLVKTSKELFKKDVQEIAPFELHDFSKRPSSKPGTKEFSYDALRSELHSIIDGLNSDSE